MIKPLNNHCLVEIIDDYAGLVHNQTEDTRKGRLIDYAVMSEHLTASTGHSIDMDTVEGINGDLHNLVGKVVYYQQYADTGSIFEQDNKRYALVPFYRLSGYEEE